MSNQKIIEAAKNLANTFLVDYTKLGNPEYIYKDELKGVSRALADDLINLHLVVLEDKDEDQFSVSDDVLNKSKNSLHHDIRERLALSNLSKRQLIFLFEIIGKMTEKE